jgi:predicted amidohydrolase
MHIVGCQFDIAWEDKPANFERVWRMLEPAPPPPGSLIVLPEMFATGFSMRTEVVREDASAPSLKFLSKLAATHRSGVIGGVVGVDEQGRLRNEAVAFDSNGAPLARYAKRRPFSGASEGEFYFPGTVPEVFEFGGFVIGLMICYDLRFPEVARECVARGANLLVNIASWPSKRWQHWLTLLEARAIENQAFVVGVNRCGHDPHHSYPGRSVIVDPHGIILADAGQGERLVRADIDLRAATDWRREFPAFRDAGFEETAHQLSTGR